MKFAASVIYENPNNSSQKREMKIFTTKPGIQLYTCNNINPLALRGNKNL